MTEKMDAMAKAREAAHAQLGYIGRNCPWCGETWADEVTLEARAYAEQQTKELRKRLEASCDDMRSDPECTACPIGYKVNKAEQQTKELRADAERYRWLRQHHVDSYLACGRMESLDADIDRAMGRES